MKGNKPCLHNRWGLNEYNNSRVTYTHDWIPPDKKIAGEAGNALMGCFAGVHGWDGAILEAVWVDEALRTFCFPPRLTAGHCTWFERFFVADKVLLHIRSCEAEDTRALNGFIHNMEAIARGKERNSYNPRGYGHQGSGAFEMTGVLQQIRVARR